MCTAHHERTTRCWDSFVGSPLHGWGSRIDLPHVKKAHGYSLLLSTAMFALHVRAQTLDTTAIGGPEGPDPYSFGEVDNSAPSLSNATTAEDSAHFIPSYELYGDFNTETIFERVAEAAKDSVVLQLSQQACDHYMPVCGHITSPFGPRWHRMHYGLDLKLDRGDTVVSAFEGVVRVSRFHRQFGNVVVIRHANGLETLYGHLSQRLVESGDHVEAGQVLGLGGSTGRSTGDHLHFETRYRGQPIDPQLLFNVEDGELRTSMLSVHPGMFSTAKPHPAKSTVRTHIVRRGDTLFSIARKHGITVRDLCRRNRISARSSLRVGQRLRF